MIENEKQERSKLTSVFVCCSDLAKPLYVLLLQIELYNPFTSCLNMFKINAVKFKTGLEKYPLASRDIWSETFIPVSQKVLRKKIYLY